MVNNVWTIMVTIMMLILPFLSSADNVKYSIKSSEVITHRHMNTTIHQYIFPDRADDGMSKVVIDAGHGGHDPGTKGAQSYEKEIALQIALKFGQKLKDLHPDIQVIYTRTSDVFIPLHERIAKANRNKADLFISIHCNYVDNPTVCGSETFVMGLHRADDNLKVAKRENSVVLMENDFEKNYDGYDPNSPVGHILLSMYQNAFLDKSIEFASSIENSLKKRRDKNSRGVKQAGFVVLREATMPSVLVETGFLSNPKEEAYLMSHEGQHEMATKLTNSVRSYFDTMNSEKREIAHVKQTKETKVTTPEPSATPVTPYGQDGQTTSRKTVSTTSRATTTPSTSSTKTIKTASGATTTVARVGNTKSSPSTSRKTTTHTTKTTPTSRPVTKTTSTAAYKSYTIQIGVFSESKQSYFKQYDSISDDIIELMVGDKFKYVIGKFSDKNEAFRACHEIKKAGLKDAFVTELNF